MDHRAAVALRTQPARPFAEPSDPSSASIEMTQTINWIVEVGPPTLATSSSDHNEWSDEMRRFLKVPAVFAVSLVILTGSPALATQLPHHGAYCRSRQNAGVCSHPTFGICVAGESCAPGGSGANTTHDDWPANMILG
jgi:hypothetical protein